MGGKAGSAQSAATACSGSGRLRSCSIRVLCSLCVARGSVLQRMLVAAAYSYYSTEDGDPAEGLGTEVQLLMLLQRRQLMQHQHPLKHSSTSTSLRGSPAAPDGGHWCSLLLMSVEEEGAWMMFSGMGVVSQSIRWTQWLTCCWRLQSYFGGSALARKSKARSWTSGYFGFLSLAAVASFHQDAPLSREAALGLWLAYQPVPLPEGLLQYLPASAAPMPHRPFCEVEEGSVWSQQLGISASLAHLA